MLPTFVEQIPLLNNLCRFQFCWKTSGEWSGLQKKCPFVCKMEFAALLLVSTHAYFKIVQRNHVFSYEISKTTMPCCVHFCLSSVLLLSGAQAVDFRLISPLHSHVWSKFGVALTFESNWPVPWQHGSTRPKIFVKWVEHFDVKRVGKTFLELELEWKH